MIKNSFLPKPKEDNMDILSLEIHCDSQRSKDTEVTDNPRLYIGECPYCGMLLTSFEYVFHLIQCRNLYNPLGTRDAEPSSS